MKIAGTLKAEIIKPIDDTWDNIGARLRSLRDTLAPALTRTMRELYPYAIDFIESIKSDAPKDETKAAKKAFDDKVEPILRKHWNSELSRRESFLLESGQSSHIRRGSQKKKINNVDPVLIRRSCEPVREYISSETRNNILVRFNKKPLNDLIASRTSIPSWVNGCAFYARNRECPVSGKLNEARIEFPLFGGGKKRTTFAIAPCGKGHEALWLKLIRDFETQRERSDHSIAINEMKLGRVGISYDEKKRKWFVLISWTEERDIKSAGEHTAAVNLGIHTFLQAISDEGDLHRVEGNSILAQRKRFSCRRIELTRALNTNGSGSKGHGKKRRFLPITKLDDAESRWMTTKCRVIAADLIKWCLNHQIGKLILEDLSAIRDSHEISESHINVRRLINFWSFAELIDAIQRQGLENGVEVSINDCSYNSQCCPNCGHTSENNVKLMDTCVEEKIDSNGNVWKRSEKKNKFACEKCFFERDGDIVAAANALYGKTGLQALKKAYGKNKKQLGDSVVSVMTN